MAKKLNTAVHNTLAMKKLISAFIITAFVISCNSGGSGGNENATSTNNNDAPSTDSTVQPDGVTNSSITSRDTGAMSQNSFGVDTKRDSGSNH